MNQALNNWREEFSRRPVESLDRLMRGVVPLGSLSQLSIGELLDLAFEPENEGLDGAVRIWLEERILQRVPEGMTASRWTAVLDEFFRAIATMGLTQTGRLLREEHSRLRLWLRGLYEGPDRDPEGSYLLALAYCQTDQRFSPLWRRLVLAEELSERAYRDIGLLGFRKMPDAQGHPPADVPPGLLQALLEVANRRIVELKEWLQIGCSVFAAYRRTENYWVRHFRTAVESMPACERHVDEWLKALLPRWHRGPRKSEDAGAQRPAMLVPIWESLDWVKRVAENPDLSEGKEFKWFLERHRAYARTTGDAEPLVKTFNSLAARLTDRGRAESAIPLIGDAFDWQPTNPHNWTVYARALWAADQRSTAKDILWEARQRIPWNPFIRTELGRLLQVDGELETSVSVYREAASHFPNNPFCRTGLAETLRQLGCLGEARQVYEQTAQDFPDDAVCRSGLADLLIDLGDLERAETLFREARRLDSRDAFARNGLAEVWFIKSARTQDTTLRDTAKSLLQELVSEGDRFAERRLRNFDQRWQLAVERGGIRFEREPSEDQLPPPMEEKRPTARVRERALGEMSIAERLGRAMIALWQAERVLSREDRDRLCDQGEEYLDVAETEMGDLQAAFVETRGLILLARGDARAALDYFAEQINVHGRGGWIGVRLGEQRARLMVGDTASPLSDETPFDSQNARFAFQVATVMRRLAANANEQEIGRLLRHLYPHAASLAEQCAWSTDEERHPSRSSGNGEMCRAAMIADFIQAKWFRSMYVTSAEDLNDPQRLIQVIANIRETQNDAFDVLANAGMAMAA